MLGMWDLMMEKKRGEQRDAQKGTQSELQKAQRSESLKEKHLELLLVGKMARQMEQE